MTRETFWRNDYRATRYMQHLDDDKLKVRAGDIFSNLLVLTLDAKIGLPPLNADTEQWMRIWTHILEEFVIRFGSYPAGFDTGFIRDTPVPDPRAELAERAAFFVKNRQEHQTKSFFKYGKSKYMKPAFEGGLIRVNSAANYDDPSLNHAIRDDELSVTLNPSPEGFRIDVFDGQTRNAKGSMKPTDIEFTTTSQSNYFVYCLSQALCPRLFQDFDDADSCLIISKPDTFVDRLAKGMRERCMDYDPFSGQVNYVDPLTQPPKRGDVFFTKHFRYAYQREFRIAWLPRSPKEELHPEFLELGTLDDCCEYVEL